MIKQKLIKPVVKALVNNDVMDIIEDNMMPLKKLMAYYNCAIMQVETKFNVLNEEFSLEYDRNPIESIKTRLKSLDSIVKKLTKRNLPITTESIKENLNDVAGVRVICSFTEDIYLLADCLLQQDDVKLIQVKDYIKNPKPNGYRSLHLIIEVPIFLKDEKKNIRVEVQLRTIAMDFWASLDHKLSYKKDIPEDEASILKRELLECAQASSDLDQRMEDIKNRIVDK
ncbi:MAG: GTP pyrophosphokinase family protein [Intestinibacter bartlettii]|uniref:GTP pyrophosphokinase family protein n=2 Tax=Intestinibacter bartlettii TaxID=261299 RepID=A0ABS6DZN2_9FIRM|nr:GTP pyrophosphokinase family protein [Intestinibacter bartlettii]MBU5337296.1 GTP pyrophosphokinase family protein [Intestinibacter bartlettii]MDO5010446.1 GTP pyrophosphokinase family protein [Intestinibacter bartlettii]